MGSVKGAIITLSVLLSLTLHQTAYADLVWASSAPIVPDSSKHYGSEPVPLMEASCDDFIEWSEQAEWGKLVHVRFREGKYLPSGKRWVQYSGNCWYGSYDADGSKRGAGIYTIVSGPRICPTGYVLEEDENGITSSCNLYCPLGSDENCLYPPQNRSSCTESDHPIDFVQGRKYREEELIDTSDNFPVKLNYMYNNRGNWRLTKSGKLSYTNSNIQRMELRDTARVITDPYLINEQELVLHPLTTTISGFDSSGGLYQKVPRYTGNATQYWRHSYEDFLLLSGHTATLYKADGQLIRFNDQGISLSHPSVQLLTVPESEYGYPAYRLVKKGMADRVYDDQGRLRVVEKNGQRHVVQYASNGVDIDSIEHTNGTVLHFEYNQAGQLYKIISSDSSVPEVTLSWRSFSGGGSDYDLLTKVSKSYSGRDVSLSRRFEYNDSRWPVSITEIYDSPTGEASDEQLYAEFRYDDTGRAVYSSLAEGVEAVSVAYPTDDIRQVTNALGKTTTYQFGTINGVRRLASVTGEPTSDCLESNTHFQYDDSGNVTLKTVNGVSTRYEYNEANLQTKRIEALGTAEERTIITRWDLTLRKPLEVEYPDRLIQYTYDDSGNQLSRSVTPKD